MDASLRSSIEAHQFVTPTSHHHDSKAELNAELLRLSNQNAALAAMVDEQQARIQQQKMRLVLNTLVDGISRERAARAEADERQARVAFEWRHQVMEDVRSAASRRHAAAATEAERAARLEAGPSPVPDELHGLRALLNETIERNGRRASAVEAAEAAQRERVHADQMDMITDEMVRTIGRMAAMKAADVEQAERAALDRIHDVCDEIRRVTAATAAARAANEEQIRRIAELAEDASYVNVSSADDAISLSAYYGDAVTSGRKAAVNEAVTRRGNRTHALAEMEAEQQRRQVQNAMLRVCDEVERSAAQREATRTTAVEQAQRTTLEQLHRICEQLRSVSSRRAAAEAAAEEQVWRANSGIDRTYWVTDPGAISEAKHDVNAQVERLGQTAHARYYTELEQVERVHQQTMHGICDELRRSVNARQGLKASEMEQAQQVTLDRIHELCDEVRRVANRRDAAAAADAERAERVAQAPATREPVDGVTTALHEAIIRRGNQTSAVDAMEAERAARIHQDRMSEVGEQLRRKTAQREAVRAMAEVQQAKVHELEMQRVLDGLVARHKRNAAREVTTAEKEARIARGNSQLTESLKELHKLVGAQIVAQAC